MNTKAKLSVAASVVCAVMGLLISQRKNSPPSPAASAGATASDEAAPPAAPLNLLSIVAPKAVPRAETPLPPKQDELWRRPVNEPPFAAFANWTQRYLDASPADRAALEAEGVTLARARQTALADLIQQQPERALELAVPDALRRAVPAVVGAWLEERVNTRAEFKVLGVLTDGGPGGLPTVLRYASIGGEKYQAFTFGEGERLVTKKEGLLNGIAVPAGASSRPAGNSIVQPAKLLALNPNPVRVLDDSEVSALHAVRAAEPVCAISSQPVASQVEETVVQVGGQIHSFCGKLHASSWANAQVAAAGLETPGPEFPVAESPYTEGRKRFLMMLPIFTDYSVTMTTNQAVSHFVQTSNYLAQMSYGKFMFAGLGQGSDITPPLPLPGPSTNYGGNGLGPLFADSKTVSQNTFGYDLNQYDFIFVVTDGHAGYGYCGLGRVGGVGFHTVCWDYAVTAHEFGHNLGLLHANYWNTTNKTIIGTGANQEYGDGNDPMGGGGNPNHFNSRYKNYVGWIPDSDIPNLTNSGLHRLYAFDGDYGVGVRGLKRVRTGSQNYWLQFRQRKTSKPALMNGVQLIWTGNGNQGSQLLDVRLKGNSDDNAIVIGRTFSDVNNAFHFTPIGKGHTFPESMDVVVNVGSFPTNLPPTALLASSPANPSANQSVTLSAVAADPNGDTLAYYWEFGDGGYSYDNSPTTTHTYTGNGEYAAQCTVSDMKGGTARHTLIVRVGNPGTFRISGHVLDSQNRPVSGAKIVAGSTRPVFSDSDGSYTVVNLSAGTYAMSCLEPVAGTLVFTNRLALVTATVGPGVVDYDFLEFPSAGYRIVYLAAPTDNAAFAPPTNLVLTANAFSDGAAVTLVEFYDGAVKIGEAPSSPYTFTLSNATLGAHLLRAVATIGGTPRTSPPVNVVVSTPVIVPPSGVLPLVAAGAAWRYFATNSAPAGAWASPGYNDAGWSNGPAQFGYGDGDEATVIPFGSDANNKWITSYYRRTFTVADPAAVLGLALSLKRDDGAVIYLNGVEVLRDNLPAGAVVFGTLASATAPDDGANFTGFSPSPAALVAGTNVIAVEIHQSGLTSSDVSFDLTLDATVITNRPRGIELTAPLAGAAVLLPGNVNLAADAAAGGALAVTNVAFYADGSFLGRDTNAPYTFIWSGPSIGAHSLLAVASDSAGVSFTSAPVNITVSAPPLGTALISFGDVWKYLDDGSDQGTNWSQRLYNDSAWSAGAARLGYGGGELTTLSSGPNSSQRNITAYFRHAFNVPNPAVYSGLLLRLVRDDGAVVYLNDVEIFRTNLLAGLASWNSLALNVVNAPEDATPVDVLLPVAGLLAGTNVVAVELHQQSITSSDAGFDLSLLGLVATNTVQGVYLTSPAEGQHCNQPASVALTAYAAAPSPVTLVEYYDGAVKIGQAAASPFSFTLSNAAPGAHAFTARATAGALSLTSAPVNIVIGPPPPLIAPVFDTLIASRSAWQFWDSSTNVAAGWAGANFDDTAWPSANARFGWGLDGELTPLTPSRITHYFRRSINVPNPAAFTELVFQLARDDGAVLYLNGVEIFRSNLPTGLVVPTTLAASAVNTPDETTYYETVVPLAGSGLVAGTNVIAVELHQNSAGSSDGAFDLQLLALGTTERRVNLTVPLAGVTYLNTALVPLLAFVQTGGTATVSKVEFFANVTNHLGETLAAPWAFSWEVPASGLNSLVARATFSDGGVLDSAPVNISVGVSLVTTQFIAAGSVWRYSDKGLNLGTNWAQPGFNTAGWSNGPARLGYGGDGEVTVVSYGPDANNKYVTTYFRNQFVVPPDQVLTNLLFNLLRDDGAVVWLNGREVFRSNLPAGAVTSTTLASASVGGTDEQTFFPTTIAVTNLPPGTNVVAVEIHQILSSSSDLSFALELTASGYSVETAGPPPLLSAAGFSAGQVTLVWPASAAGYRVYRTSTVPMTNPSWSPVNLTPVVTNGLKVLTITPAGPVEFYRLGKP